MTNSKFASDTLKAVLSILLVGGIGVWCSSLSAKILTHENTDPHLEGVVVSQTNRSDGQVINSPLEPTIELSSERATEKTSISYSDLIQKTNDDSSSDWKVEAASQDWENLNHGEGSQDIVRFVVWQL